MFYLKNKNFMKYVFFPILLLTFCFQLNAQVSKTEKLLTKRSWFFKMDAGKFLNDQELSIISFTKDGNLTVTRLKNGVKTNGNWKLDNDGKKLSFNLVDKSTLFYEISAIDSKAMTLLREGEISKAVNVPNNYKLPQKERSKKLVGAWLISKRNGENVEDLNEMIQFNADGTAIANNQTEIATWETRKDVLSLNTRITETLGFEVSKDKKKLTLNSRGLILELSKTKQIVTPLIKKEEPELEINLEEFFDNPNNDNDKKTNLHSQNQMDKSKITGNWKVKILDGEEVTGRKMIMYLTQDGKFSVMDDEVEARKGDWNLSGHFLILDDTDGNYSEYSVNLLNDGTLILKDFISEFTLTKIP